MYITHAVVVEQTTLPPTQFNQIHCAALLAYFCVRASKFLSLTEVRLDDTQKHSQCPHTNDGLKKNQRQIHNVQYTAVMSLAPANAFR